MPFTDNNNVRWLGSTVNRWPTVDFRRPKKLVGIKKIFDQQLRTPSCIGFLDKVLLVANNFLQIELDSIVVHISFVQIFRLK